MTHSDAAHWCCNGCSRYGRTPEEFRHYSGCDDKTMCVLCPVCRGWTAVVGESRTLCSCPPVNAETLVDLLGAGLAEKALRGSYSAYAPDGFMPQSGLYLSGLENWRGYYALLVEEGGTLIATEFRLSRGSNPRYRLGDRRED